MVSEHGAGARRTCLLPAVSLAVDLAEFVVPRYCRGVERLKLDVDYTSATIWMVGDCSWGDAPISDRLSADLDRWYEIWEASCYLLNDQWSSEATCSDWTQMAWRLVATANRELLPQGYVVLPAFNLELRGRYPGFSSADALAHVSNQQTAEWLDDINVELAAQQVPPIEYRL